LESAGRIIADLPDVSRLQPPLRAGEDSAGYLPSGKDLRLPEFNLGAEGRETREPDKRIGGVQPHADNINDGKQIMHPDTLRKIGAGANGK
jgi:hypothetical protein